MPSKFHRFLILQHSLYDTSRAPYVNREKKSKLQTEKQQNGGITPTTTTPPEGRWGIVVVIAAFFSFVLVQGSRSSFGVFYSEMLKYYGESRATTAWISSIMTGSFAGISFISSILVEKYSCRAVAIIGSLFAALGFLLSVVAPHIHFLYFSAGFLTGSGFGMANTAVILYVNFYFIEHRALALGVVYSGAGIGTSVMAYLSQFLIDTYAWQGAMLITSGVVLNIVVCAALFRPVCRPNSECSLKTIGSSTARIMKDFRFVTIAFCNFMLSLGFDVPYLYTKNRALVMDIAGETKASMLLICIGLSSTAGRVLAGLMASRIRTSKGRLWLYNMCNVISGSVTCLSCYATTYELMAMYCAAYGATSGGYIVLHTVILADLLGRDNLSLVFGLITSMEAVPRLIGPPVTGWLYDILGSYDPGFIFSGSMIAADGFFMFLMPYIAEMEERHLLGWKRLKLEKNNAKNCGVPLTYKPSIETKN